MENIELSMEEKLELEKRGLYVKRTHMLPIFIKILGIEYYHITTSIIFYTIPWIILIGGITTMTDGVIFYALIITLSIFSICSTLYFFIKYLLSGLLFYLKAGMNFYSGDGKVISLGEIGFKQSNKFKSVRIFWRDINKAFHKISTSYNGKVMVFFLIIFTTPLVVAFITGYLKILLYSLLGTFIFLEILRTSFQSLHPLYAFGNLGEKIQKFTPEIEIQSQLIQSEFQKDMNFSVLHSGFEKLSRTFSSIVELVVRLEKIEARANKGNLFDSAKYIGSLRTDIVIPLTELKKFLEGQRKQLLESKRELSRVRVGGPDTTANIELQSKRSESLLQELDSNIAALGEMVEKMG